MSDNTFTLTIHLGNAAMQNAEDVAFVLRRVACELEAGSQENTVKDYNGNRVGVYGFSTELIDTSAAYRDDDQRLGGYDNPYPED